MLAALILQVLLEFGPLWLVALAAPAVLYGPHWAGLMSSLGVGGLLAGRFDLSRPRTAAGIAGLMVSSSLVLTVSRHVAVVTAAQIILALLVVAASVHVSRLLHDAVPSTVRSGVASGVSTFSWIAFLPVALVFGLLSEHHGVHTAGWLVTAVTVPAGLLLLAAAALSAAWSAALSSSANVQDGNLVQSPDPAIALTDRSGQDPASEGRTHSWDRGAGRSASLPSAA